MTPEMMTEAVVGLIGWTAMLAVLQFMVLPLARETLRQRLFELRRELFLFMLEGNIGRKDAAYLKLRRLTNTFIRHAEKVTFLRCVFANLFYDPRLARHERLGVVIEKVSNKRAREYLRLFHARVSGAIMWHIILISPIAWCVTVLVLPAMALDRGMARLARVRFRNVKNFLRWVPARVPPIRRFEEQAPLLACDEDGTCFPVRAAA